MQGGRGSYAAVGTFRPGIELWDLDVLDPLEPTRVLGGERALHHRYDDVEVYQGYVRVREG